MANNKKNDNKPSQKPATLPTVTQTKGPLAPGVSSITGPAISPPTNKQMLGSSAKVGLSSVGANLSKKEAQNIADSRGTSVGKIMDKAMNKGLTIGSGLVNAYNSGKYSSTGDNIWKSLIPQFGVDASRKMFGISDNMQGLSGLKLNPNQIYSGSYTRNGELAPIVGTRGSASSGGSKGSTTTTTATNPAPTANPTPTLDPTPTVTPTVTPVEANPVNVDSSFSPGGSSAALDGGANGFRRRRSSARTNGLTSRGTSQFKIGGQGSRSSGLNIGT